jgi:hypothetical protein
MNCGVRLNCAHPRNPWFKRARIGGGTSDGSGKSDGGCKSARVISVSGVACSANAQRCSQSRAEMPNSYGVIKLGGKCITVRGIVGKDQAYALASSLLEEVRKGLLSLQRQVQVGLGGAQ